MKESVNRYPNKNDDGNLKTIFMDLNSFKVPREVPKEQFREIN